MGHIIFERIPKVYHASTYYWMKIRNNNLTVPGFPVTEEKIKQAKLNCDEAERI